MKLSYTTLSVQDRTIREAVEIASAHGLEGIELRGRGDSHVSPESTFSYAAHVRELVREHKLAVPCLTAYTRFHQPTAAAVREEVDRMMDMVRLAEFLEAPCLRVFMGPVPEAVSLLQEDQIAIEGLQYASKRLGNSPVRLVIETHDSAKDGRTLARILKDVPSNIGVLLDIIHPWDMGEEIGKTWKMIGERIYHVHIKDISRTLENGRIYCPIGQGLLPVESTVRWLESKGYQGFYSLEWEKSAQEGQGVGFEEQLESFVSFMRGVEQDGNSQITLEEVKACLCQVLAGRGCPEKKAEKVAHEMARNSLEGVYTHGINRFSRLVRNIDEGIVRPGAEPEVTVRMGAMEQVDGHLGLGITNAWFAMEEAVKLAKSYGIGLVALRNTNHWMRAATYGYQACDEGMAAVCFTNTMPNMPTWGAVDSRIGNNPLVFAFPRREGHLITDMAMSQFSYGALELARLQGRQMAIDAGFDTAGNLTRDPDSVIKSQRILPTGYWKGAALSFMLDIFAGVLSDGNTVSEVGRLAGDEHGVSQVFIVVDYRNLVTQEAAERIVEGAVKDLLASEKAQGTDRIIYTGQLTLECRADNLKNGIPVDEGVWSGILSLL